MFKHLLSLKYSLWGLIFSVLVYVITMIFDLDLMELIVGWMRRTEFYEIDELLIAIVPVFIGLAGDFLRISQAKDKDSLKLQTMRATMRSVDDIVGNAHNQLTYYVYLAKQKGSMDQEMCDRFNQILVSTQDRLNVLRSQDKVVEKELAPGIMVLDPRPKD